MTEAETRGRHSLRSPSLQGLSDLTDRQESPILARLLLLTSAEDRRALWVELTLLNELGQLNCLLSDGERLYCYHDQQGYKGLTFRKIHLRDGETRRFEDGEVEINLAEGSVNYGFVVATNPLSRHGWQRFLPGELIVLEKGMMRFSSHRTHADAGIFATFLPACPPQPPR